jgi:hypothetical protein
MSPIEKVTEGKYPKDIRKALNLCIDRLNRPMTVEFSNTITEPTITEGDNQIIISIPTTTCP